MLESDSEMTDWLVERDSKCGVVLHDRLMTDAAIGAAPIKTEHSYSLHSDDSNPPSPHTKVDGEYLFLFGIEEAALRPGRATTCVKRQVANGCVRQKIVPGGIL